MELADQISSDFADKEPIMVGILNGAVFFFCDLIREMKLSVKIDFIRAASYGSGSSSSGEIRFTKDLELPIKNQPVIIVEDIIDTGLTLNRIMEILRQRDPLSISICALIDKEERREQNVSVEYYGFKVKQGFLVGYGLDYNEEYRHLPDIYIMD
jgi:hypoxanthine phosphoribosyltransferase